jgi:outer membrane protein with beta-barrel domain
MKKYFAALFLILVYAGTCSFGQDEAPRYTFNIGGGFGIPQSSVSDFSNIGGNFVIGAGVNSGRGLGFNGEFMWQDLPPKPEIVALTGAPDGSARMYSVTGNLLLHSSEQHRAGVYGIGGIGWYHRSWELTRPTVSIGSVCLPSYVWWGVVCQNGLVSSDAIINSGSSDGFGWNIGAGLTYRLGESHAKLYTEARFHYAYHTGINTKVLPIVFGLRW